MKICVICEICVTSLMSFCHADSADAADFSYPILLLNQMKNNLRHPIDRTGLNLCKSVKSVGLKKELVRKNLRHLRNLRDLIILTL